MSDNLVFGRDDLMALAADGQPLLTDGLDVAPKKAEIASRLRALAHEMEWVAAAMDYYGGFAYWASHGREIAGAGRIAREWANDIEAANAEITGRTLAQNEADGAYGAPVDCCVSSEDSSMGMNCQKDAYKGRCCCNCEHQRVIVKHPWNDGAGKGRVTETMGYGCEPPDFQDDGKRQVVFFDGGHGLCEMHDMAANNNIDSA